MVGNVVTLEGVLCLRRYTSLPAFTLPKAAQGFKSCEMTMGRRNVHACHAGALVHSLEGWKHHEVSLSLARSLARSRARALSLSFSLPRSLSLALSPSLSLSLSLSH